MKKYIGIIVCGTILLTAYAAYFIKYIPLIFTGEITVTELLRLVLLIVSVVVLIYYNYVVIWEIRNDSKRKSKKSKAKEFKKSSSWLAAVTGMFVISPRNNYYETKLTLKGQIRVEALFLLLYIVLIIAIPARVIYVWGYESFLWPQVIVFFIVACIAALAIWQIVRIRKMIKELKK